MYQVFKNGNRSIRKNFLTYEEARQAVRKLLRTQANLGNTIRNSFWTSNPMIGDYGYSIKKV